MLAGRIAEFHHVPGTTIARLFNFGIAQDRLKPEHQAWLRKNVIDLLRKGGSLWIMGLTSTTGSESFNFALSKRRAESVVAFLRRELSKDFPVTLEGYLGEVAARIAGLRDNTEDANWRAVLLGAWDKPVPPPPPPPAPVQETCKRTVIYSSDGAEFYAAYEGRGAVKFLGAKVKATPDFIKCATDFERKYSFLAQHEYWPAGWQGPMPVVWESPQDYIDRVAGEVVGHYMPGVSRSDILAETAILKRLPSPYNQSFLALPVEALFNGYVKAGQNHENVVQFGFKVPLYVLDKSENGGYTRLAKTTEGSPSRYDVITDIYGQIIAIVSGQSSRYPKSETTLHVIVKTVVIKTVKIILKNLWRLI